MDYKWFHENLHFLKNFFGSVLTVSDDLGRVVIPKEIRRTMRIREGEPLQIYIVK